MRSIIALIWSMILPGTGHILHRKYLKGAVLAPLFAACGSIFLAGYYLVPFASGTILPWVALALAAGVWAFAITDLAISLKSRAAKDFRSRSDELLKAAQVAWLRDDYPEAERLLRDLLGRDERDIEAWIHLGKILKSVGRQTEARTCFRSAVNLDGSDTWRYMLAGELGSVSPAEAKSAATP